MRKQNYIMKYTRADKKGKQIINSVPTFVDALKGRKVLDLSSFESVMKDAENLVRSEHVAVEKSALSNVRGNWYEWLLAIGSVEFNNLNPTSKYLLPLPNVSSYDCSKLYVKPIFNLIQDLREKVSKDADASLITSNPDFVIVERTMNLNIADLSQGVTAETIGIIDNTFNQLSHRCELADIAGYASSKSSLRPDRRLQIAHEGSLMKALYRHVITRNWIQDSKGIKYYALTSKASAADRKGLKTIATHSIVDVNSKAEAAVDGLFCISSGKELSEALTKILA